MNHLDPPNLTTYNRGCKTTIFNSTVLSPVKSSSIEDGVWTHCLFQRLCVTHLWILGVTVASDFSVTDHVQELDNEVCPDLVRPTRLTGTWAE